MLFGIFGCKAASKKTNEDIVRDYLCNKYGKDFSVSRMIQKGEWPDKDDFYSGTAYCNDNPNDFFNVWLSLDKKQVSDAYFSLTFADDINDYVQNSASKIWDRAYTSVSMDITHSVVEAKKNSKNWQEFAGNGVYVSVRLVLENVELTVEDFSAFNQLIADSIRGCVYIYIVNTDGSRFLLSDELKNREPDYSIPTESTDRMIRYNIKGTFE